LLFLCNSGLCVILLNLRDDDDQQINMDRWIKAQNLNRKQPDELECNCRGGCLAVARWLRAIGLQDYRWPPAAAPLYTVICFGSSVRLTPRREHCSVYNVCSNFDEKTSRFSADLRVCCHRVVSSAFVGVRGRAAENAW